MFALAALLAFAPPAAPTELRDYLAEPKLAFAWHLESQAADLTNLNLTSGIWHGETWRHRLVIVHPPSEDRRHTAILMITGDKVSRANDPDIAQARDLARHSHFPVAVLYDIPNQPLVIEDGTVTGRHDRALREDDLIAYSFQRYLETSDASWLALFPMTRSALRAMDVVSLATETTNNPIRKFVVTGESKRGWTTWMVGAAQDKRVIGIVPVAFDFLNFPAQLKRQVELWGKPSEMLASYTSQGLDQLVNSEPGKRLIRQVDPYSYRALFKVPTLIVRGSNDPYWATDATRFYYDELPQPHSLLVLPNEGHDFVHKDIYTSTVAAFARSCTSAFKWPRTVPLLQTKQTDFSPAKADSVSVWGAGVGNFDLRKASWTVGLMLGPDKIPETIEWIPGPRPPIADFASFKWRIVEAGGVENTITLCSPPEFSPYRG